MKIDCSRFTAKWLVRTKELTLEKMEKTKLSRAIGLFELTNLSISAMLGSGIFVVAPDAAKYHSGPALFLSFIIAAVASMLSGLCYSELGARIPRAGSAYVYTYVSIGEIWAFIVGWNMILEYIIGTAATARAAVSYIDVIADGALGNAFTTYLPISVPFLGTYFDPIAFGMVIVLTVILAVGVQESTFVNNFLVVINVIVTIIVIGIGFAYINPGFWDISAAQVFNATNSTSFGVGGFTPYGVGGVITAASSAFYAFVGFDCIASTGEEVINPQRNIPLSIILSLAVCTVLYVLMAVVFTMQTPYYNMSPATLLESVPHGSQIVVTAALISVFSGLIGSLLPVPRIIYAMAEDGLLFRFLGTINSRFKTPLIATMFAGGLTALFAGMFDVLQLVNMLSIGTLTAYSTVATCVLILRYRESFIDTVPVTITDEEHEIDPEGIAKTDILDSDPITQDQLPRDQLTHQPETPHEVVEASTYAKAVVSCKSYDVIPTAFTSKLAIVLTAAIAVVLFTAAIFASVAADNLQWAIPWPLIVFAVFGFIALLLVIRMGILPQNVTFKTFKVPLSPGIPFLALAINFYLITSLDVDTWIRFAVWMLLGFLIYFLYGIWTSGTIVHEVNESGENSNIASTESVKTEDTEKKSYGSMLALLQFRGTH